MNCKRFKDKLPLLVLGELEQKEQDELERHLNECDECREELDSLREITDILGSGDEARLGELEQLKLEREIYRRLAVHTNRGETMPLTGRVFKLLIRIAAVVLIFLAGYTAYPLISEQVDSQPLNARIEKSLNADADIIETLGNKRFTPQGLLVIARGKEVLKK